MQANMDNNTMMNNGTMPLPNQHSNNIGIIQNFNSYHIELKNMAGNAANAQAVNGNFQGNQLGPDDIKSLDRLVRQQQNMTTQNNTLSQKKGVMAAGVVSPRPGQSMATGNPYLNSLDTIIQKSNDKGPQQNNQTILSQKQMKYTNNSGSLGPS
jgi:hypothetical protein